MTWLGTPTSFDREARTDRQHPARSCLLFQKLSRSAWDWEDTASDNLFLPAIFRLTSILALFVHFPKRGEVA